MSRLLAGIVIGGLGVFAYQRATRPDPVSKAAPVSVHAENPEAAVALPAVERDTPNFNCDGRIYCSQMTSCEEATYFLQHCPGVKMDGDNHGRGDGIPCEAQWCGQH
jgi:hypothetical protein